MVGSRTRRVLVVDDERLIRESLCEVLTAEGYDVVAAADATEAIQRVNEVEFGVAIIDKNLPGKKNGLDVVRHAHEVRPSLKTIVFTAYPSVDAAIAAMRGGAFDYIEKPIDNPLLVDQVQRAWNAHEAEEARLELLRKYESLFEIVPGIVWFMTKDGKIRRINNEGAALLGYDTSELLGQPYSVLLAPDEDQTGVHWAFKERRTGKRATRRQLVELRTKPGDTRIFEINSTGAWDRSIDAPDKRMWGTIGVGWDVTEHAALEVQLEQARRMEALGRLAGGVAHDFNNVLAVVMHNAEHLLDELHEADPLREDAVSLEEVATRGTDLTRQLLTLSRKKVIEFEAVGLGEIVERLQPLLRRLIPEHIHLELAIADDTRMVRADASQLEQVVVNLVVNARDAMPDGGRLSLTVKEVELDAEFAGNHGDIEPGQFVMLAVSDSGVGIPLNDREHMFEPFFTTKARDVGTGLGLATVYGIVKQADGHVSVYSEVGTGTSIKVYLPAREGEYTGDLHPPQFRKSENLTGRGEVVLVAEDDRLVRRQICRSLTRAGYEVLAAADGAQALEVAAGQKIQLLITDIVMPNVNGSDLARRLRADNPELRVVYMSGYVGNILDSQDMLAGAGFMQKPFNGRELTQKVRRILDEPIAESGS